jgi:RND family efflux transporter MFP subunit
VVALATNACGGAPEVVELPPPEVAVAQPVERPVADYFETTGRTAAFEEVDVRARVPGYLVRVNFTDGQMVKKGDVLFEIDPRPYQAAVLQAEGEIGRWEAQLRSAEADVARNKRLLPKGAASERELEVSIANKETAEAEIKSARARLEKAKLDLEYATIVAPIEGRASRTSITVGNLVELAGSSSAVLTTLVTLDPIYVYFDIDERALLRYQADYRARGNEVRPEHIRDLELPVELALATDDGFPHRGLLDFVDNQVNPSTGTLSARAAFDNGRSFLTPGLFCRVRMPYGDPQNARLVSERAIGTDQGGKYLLVVNDQNVVEYRAVKLGAKSDGLLVINEGLGAGEWVVTAGIQRIRPGITVKPQQGPMIPKDAAPPAAAPGA